MKSVTFKINTKTEKQTEQYLEKNNSSTLNNEIYVKEKVIDTNIITSKKPKKVVENIYYFD